VRVDTVVEILKALPGVRITTVTIGRSMNDYSELRIELSVDEQPEPHELVITVKPGDPRASQPPKVEPPFAPLTFDTCAGCGAPGQYLPAQHCEACRAERKRGLW